MISLWSKGSEHNKDLLKALNAADCQFLIIGGMAVHFHAAERDYDDLDIWIPAALETYDKLCLALAKFPTEFNVSLLHRDDFERPNKRICAKRLFYADILTGDPEAFARGYHESVEVECDGIPVRVAPVWTLLALALKSDDEKHKRDVTLLRRLGT